MALPDIGAALVDRPGNRDVNRIGDRLAVNALEQKRQRERGLKFDHHGVLIASHCNHVAVAHLSLDLITLTFQEALDRRIEFGFQHVAVFQDVAILLRTIRRFG